MSAQDSKLFVISGPSGAGKGTLVTRVRERRSNLGLTVSATTRAPRKGEVDGVNYFFLTREEFDRRVANGEFVEWAEVHGNCYGTLVSEVTSKLASGSSLILEIDVQGALQVKERFPEAVLIFIKPPSLEVLRERLVGRGTETPETIELRMANAADELALAARYDDAEGLRTLAQTVRAVTTEFENVPAASLRALADAGLRTTPSADAVAATCCPRWWAAAPLAVLVTGLSVGIVESTQARNKLARNTTFILTVAALAVLVFFTGYLLQLNIGLQ